MSEKHLYKEHKIFDIVMNDKLYEVWDRPGYEHDKGKLNNSPATWWIKFVDEEFNKLDRLSQVIRSNEIDWIPYIDIGVVRPAWEINIKSGNCFNYSKHRVSKSVCIEMSCNLKKVYEFRCRDMGYGMVRAQELMVKMNEHPFEFRDTSKEVGRKIWFYDQPAIIDSLILDQGCIMIKKDDPNDPLFDLVKPWNTKEDIEMEEWNKQSVVKDDILSTNIYWFRD